ncbi:hypothetical protein ACOARS_12805, partial [Glaesserella parasuis]|uniref:hypothetical protein n=1 Tax=Glaesserella parasuis TaxID=738 RepID=UPI003B7E5E72
TGSWNLALTEDRRAQLEIPGTGVAIPITPQLVGAREYNEILALFDVATEGVATGVALDDELELDEIPAAEAEEVEAEQLPLVDEPDVEIPEPVAAEAEAEMSEA